MILFLIAIVFAFLIGSFPTGYIIGKRVYNIDIREHGSCNLGATNVMRVLGTKPGIACLVIDVLKGFLAVWLLTKLFDLSSQSMVKEMVLALAAVAGHCLCPWLGWHGGKGVATSLGALIAIAPWQIFWVATVGVILIAVTRYVSVGSIAGAILFPIFVYFSKLPTTVFYVSVILGVILIVRHHANIMRLFQGTEKKFLPSCSCDVVGGVSEEAASVKDDELPPEADAESAMTDEPLEESPAESEKAEENNLDDEPLEDQPAEMQVEENAPEPKEDEQ